jgi:uncharacterized repeat protein (TIGR02543 family)
MNTKRFTFFFVFLLFLVQGIWAQHVSPEQAKEIASKFLKGQSTKQGGRRNAPSANMLKTAVVFNAKDMAGQPYLYAVSATLQDGFVLVSGDERFKAVLGYSDVSNFDEQNMPDNMRVFLQGYIDEMKYLESINYQPTKAAPRRSMSNVGVLMTTTWNQRAPYNNQCPLDNSQRSATGCVATAMAQVVNYHIQNDHGPAATIAEIPEYTIPNTTITVSAIPSGTAIPSKDLLLNSYANNAGTDAQKTAVAQLMLYCGTSVQMKYSSGSSGTQTAYVANALINYFGFDNTTRFVRRIDYSYADWVDLIYNEVAACRPVVLGAGRAAGGHAFVADGFDATNTLFHINWGWGGYLDDYFALSVLNPDDAGQTGAAAGTDGYTIDQQAIVGIQHVGASGTTDPASLTMDSYRVEGTDIHFSAGNLTGTTNSFDIGVGVYDGSSITLFKLIASQSISTGSSFPDVSASAICADFANQTRKLIPMSRVSETSTWIPGADPDINYFSAVYDAYGVPTLTAHPAPDFQNTTFSIPGTVFVNTPQYTNVTFTNNGEEYYGKAYFFVSTDANNKGNYVAKRGLGAPTGVPTTVEFEWTPTSATTYYIWATTDEAGTNVIGSTSVTATTDASLAGKTLAIVDYQLEGQDDQSFQIDGNGTRSIDVYGSKLKGKVTIKNLSASDYNYNGKYITLTYKKWNGSQFEMIAHPYDIGVLQPTLAGGAEYTFDVNRDGLESGLYQISLTTFEINGGYVENRTELDERYTINLKPIGMTIASASDWATFCTNVNNGTTYSGKLVKMTADITTSSRMDTNHTFSGVFDGGGHTLNITISGGSWNMAPFPVISGATIKNLTVTGSVTNTSNFTGGLVGQAMGNNNLIENCVVNTDVTGDMRIGGVVGQLTGSLTIKDVVYGGTITNEYNEAIGGFIGCYNNTDKSLTMTNCLFKGTYSGPSPFHPIGMKYNTSKTFSTLSCTNCFYTVNPQNNPDAGVVIADGTKVSQLSLGQGVSILTGNTCSFLNEVFHYGTVTLGYNDPEAVVTYSLDGTPLPDNSFTISKDNAAFDDGTATITADYSFTISYNLDGGTVATPNPTTYTSASSDITLNNPTREGWTFTGWTGTGLNGAQMTVTIAQGSTGHRHYTATWTADELDIDPSDGAYVIGTKDDWNRFCALVNSGNNYWSKTVKLTADIGTAQNPVTIKAGGWVEGNFKDFQASFDGQGHTLTVNYFDGAPFQGTINATIRNLHVAGNITASSHFAAGFVSEAHYGLTIENCRSSVAISSSVSGDGTHGGLIGVLYHDNNSNVNITGCVFDGSITTTNGTNNCGGFIGWSYNSSLTTLSNSVLKPSSVSNGMLEKTFVRYNSDTAPTITNTYYVHVDNLTENQGKEAHTITAGENVSSVAIGGTATEYNVSGITAYEGSNGLKYGSTVYAGISDAVDLALTANPPTNYTVDEYTASAGSITTNSATSATLTMPNENVTIGATWKLRELNKDNEDNYLVESKDEWDLFCLRVNNGSTYSNETIKLTGDIGDAENPVTTIAGENEIKPFKGTFDGAGYTLTIGYGTSEARFDGQYAAPFRYVEGATIQNLHVAGIIYTAKQCAAGIVGQVKESPITLSNCHSSVDINCNYENSGGHGGLIAYIWPGLNGNSITGCLFDGSFTTSNNDNHSSGLFGVAGGTTTVTNCVVMPSNVSAGMLSNTFGYGSDITFTNCYYVPVENLPTTQGTAAHAISAGTNVTSLAISTTPTTTYNVSGITLYGDNKGLMIGDVVYAAENDEVDLTLAAPSQPGATVGFVASAGTLDQTDATHATLTMPNEDVTINAVYLVSTNYIAADGTSKSQPAKELTSSDHELNSGWYVVNGTVSTAPYVVPLWDDWAGSYNYVASSRINISGDVNIILADGATLNAVNGTYTGPEFQEGREASGGIHVPAGSSLTIYRQSGGTGVLNAETNSSDDAAIGGGYPGLGWGNAHAGTITIYGGTINAIAYDSGIGGTQGSHGGTVNIYGGTVTAQCNMGAAIGGGGSCTGFTVNIYGGTVNATGGTGAAAIGGGAWGSGGTVNISGGVINATANYSTYLNDYEGYGIGGGSDCNSPTTVNLSWTNTTDRITATSYNGTVNLKKAFQDTDGATWSAADNISTKPDGKTLYPANTLLFLADNADNSADISAANGNTRNVVLSGRTLYKDGKWNTLCLPFNLTAAQIAAHADFAGATLMELNTDGKNGFDATDGTLYLAFKEATAIKAGVPYLVKWDAAGTDFTSPVFFGVTINATATTMVSDHDDELAEVQMVGCYSPVPVVANDKSILFMGDNNTLYYSTENRSIRSCRAYFSVPYINQTPGAKARAFVLNFDDEEATGILEISADSKEKKDDAWYSLAGVRLSGKPTQRGMYINKGNKVIIK